MAEPLEPEKPKEEKPALPEKLGVNKFGGFFQPSALIQFWGQYSHLEGDASDTTFRLRRVELRAKGDILPKFVSYFVNFDLTKVFSTSNTTTQVPVAGSDATTPGTVAVTQTTVAADRSPLQDATITYSSEYADVVMGQFKIPVSLEANQSASKLLFPERSRVVREFGDRRDIGVKVEKKIQDVFYYNVSLFNGQGQNVIDSDRSKDGGLRLEVYPIKGLTIAGVAYGTIFDRQSNVRDRLEADLRLELADLIVQGEFITATTGPQARRQKGQGAYGAIAYTFIERLQPAFRMGILDINTNDLPPRNVQETGVQRQFEFGLNYLLRGHDVKLTLAGALYSQEHGPDTSELTFQSQVVF
ncbi:MAG TPA: porin [Polyangiaceae bacterium]|nr:porin [Polyangiaceae bacterium]